MNARMTCSLILLVLAPGYFAMIDHYLQPIPLSDDLLLEPFCYGLFYPRDLSSPIAASCINPLLLHSDSESDPTPTPGIFAHSHNGVVVLGCFVRGTQNGISIEGTFRVPGHQSQSTLPRLPQLEQFTTSFHDQLRPAYPAHHSQGPFARMVWATRSSSSMNPARARLVGIFSPTHGDPFAVSVVVVQLPERSSAASPYGDHALLRSRPTRGTLMSTRHDNQGVHATEGVLVINSNHFGPIRTGRFIIAADEYPSSSYSANTPQHIPHYGEFTPSMGSTIPVPAMYFGPARAINVRMQGDLISGYTYATQIGLVRSPGTFAVISKSPSTHVVYKGIVRPSLAPGRGLSASQASHMQSSSTLMAHITFPTSNAASSSTAIARPTVKRRMEDCSSDPEDGAVKRARPSIECPICISDIVGNHVSTPCGHMFCASCLVQALSIHKLCPVCRTRLPHSNNNNGQYHRVFL